MKLQFFNSPTGKSAFTLVRTTTGIDLSSTQRYLVLVLAIGSTLQGEFIAACAGWESGGSLRDRLVIAAIGFLIVSSSGVLPALAGRFDGMRRVVILAAWIGCVSYALLGQATFFAVARQDAGDARAMAVNVPGTPERVDVSPGRSLTVIAQDEAGVVAKLGRAKAARCLGSECRWPDARAHALAAQLAALKIEADEATRREAQEDSAAKLVDAARALRESRRADPIASQLAILFGWRSASVEMLRTYLPAVMLELLPGLFWTLAFEGERRVVPGAANACGDQPASVAPVVATEAQKLDEVQADANSAAKPRHVAIVDEDVAAVLGAVARAWESGVSAAIRVGRQYVARFSANNK